jgi:lipid-binding SYLF domain-containing protein
MSAFHPFLTELCGRLSHVTVRGAVRVMSNADASMLSRRRLLLGLPTGLGVGLLAFHPARADSAGTISQNAWTALRTLYGDEPHTRLLGDRAKAILVFPKITKAGFMIGGQYGEGALLQARHTIAYYSIAAGSFGLQIGAQTFSYVLFFMTNSSLDYLRKSAGWSIGSGPSVVVLDKGAAASVTSTTLTQDVYAVPFGQSGLMAGIGIEGSKISPLRPS